jgi:cytoskeleton protein RodZ
MKAGTTELVEVNEPVVLVIGNAAGVDASLRGQTLNLRAVARDNVAKLSLK